MDLPPLTPYPPQEVRLQSTRYVEFLRRIPRESPEFWTRLESILWVRDRIPTLLCQQPREIVGEILNWLEPKDLLALRQVNKSFHNLVHESERAICTSFYSRISCHPGLKLSMSIPPNLSSFFYLHHKHDGISSLAETIATRISSFFRCRKYATDRNALRDWRLKKYERLRQRLIPALLILQMFLDDVSNVFVKGEVSFQDFDDDLYLSLHNIYDLDQQEVIADKLSWLTEQQFLDVTCTFSILRGMCKARGVPLNSKAHTYPFASVKQIMLYQGLSSITKLVADFLDRTKQIQLLNQMNEDIWTQKKGRKPVFCILGDQSSPSQPLSTIHHLTWRDIPVGPSIPTKRNSDARNKFIAQQDLWDRAAKAQMMRRLHRSPTSLHSNVWIVRSVLEPGELEHEIALGPWDIPDHF